MNRIIPGLTLLTAMSVLLLTACVSVNFSTSNRNEILGKGDMITQTYEAPGYTSVEIRGDFKVAYSSIPSDTVSIEMNENLVPHINVSVEDGVLLVGSKERIRTQAGQSPTLFLSTPNLEGLIIHGGASMSDWDTIEGKSFNLDVSGACSAELDFAVEHLKTSIAGAGSAKFSGTADSANIELSGACSFDALALETVNAIVDISGTGTGSITCSGVLDVDISGAGSFEYQGDCQVNPSVTGAGSVKKIG